MQEWHNTLSLIFAGLKRERAARLLTGMVGAFGGQEPQLQAVAADCLDILVARGVRMDDAVQYRRRMAFLATMVSTAPAVLRCRVGDALGRLGDPRFEPAVWFLPLADEAPLGFVRVEAGAFTMGSNATRDGFAPIEEQPEHQIDLQEFYVGRYLVTVAQFAEFVRDLGRQPSDPESFQGIPNSPAVWVWADALAYCTWLTQKLTAWRGARGAPERWLDRTIRAGWQVTLPSEAEWEKAARGTDGRVYPWGDEYDADRGNVEATGILQTTAVGAFDTGRSPSGALDISGNVWEWTRSFWRSGRQHAPLLYPYEPNDLRREDISPSTTLPRVVRGGSFIATNRTARAATRDWSDPLARRDDLGFRVVVSRLNLVSQRYRRFDRFGMSIGRERIESLTLTVSRTRPSRQSSSAPCGDR